MVDFTLPEILIQPGGEDLAGATAAGAGADVGAAAGAAGVGAGGLGAAAAGVLPILATILGPEFLDAIVGGGGGFATPAQVAANVQALGGREALSKAFQSDFGFTSPALAGELTPQARIDAAFQTPTGGQAALNPLAPGNFAGQAVPIGALPGTLPGIQPGQPPVPTPSPRPAVTAGTASPVGGGSGAGAPGEADPLAGAGVASTDPGNTIGPAGVAPAPTAGTPTNIAPTGPTTGGASSLFGGGNVPWGTLAALGGLSVGGQLLAPKLSSALGLNKVPGSEQLQNTASTAGNLSAQEAAFGTAAQQPLITGVLPAGQQAAVDRATQDAITTIKSRYASLGLSGSSMEADAIAGIQQQSLIEAGQLEQQMANTGTAAVNSASSLLGTQEQIYSNIMQAVIQQDQGLSNAISNFASSVGMGTALGTAINAGRPAATQTT